MIRMHLLIGGRVQGVFFRNFTLRAAREHGLCGWVRNLADGRVEAVLEGERAAVLTVMKKLREGPPWARVDRVDQREEPHEGLHDFQVRD